jgi:hypothetical protein
MGSPADEGSDVALPEDEGPTDPGSPPDLSEPDISPSDPGPVDAGVVDEGAPDMGTPDPGLSDPDTGTVDMGPAGLSSCDPPLTFSFEEDTFTNPFALITFIATGGTGDYEYSLADPNSDAIINPLLGSVLVGPEVGISETVHVTDGGCLGMDTTVFHVVPNLVVRPLTIKIDSLDSFTLDVSGGSGEYSFQAIQFESGGAVDKDGIYTAGGNAGLDKVGVYDVLTSQSLVVNITVTKGVNLQVQPGEAIVPVGHRIQLSISGGSGFFSLESNSPGVTIDDHFLLVNALGEAVVTVNDNYTSASTEIRVTGITSQGFDAQPVGINSVAGKLLSPGDIDGDGYADAILAEPYLHASGYYSGVVHIYRGGPQGLESTPARTFVDEERQAQKGWGLDAADINQDGLVDLVIGTRLADFGYTDNGRVDVYLGVQGQFFSQEPTQTFAGYWWSDSYGASATLCDFSGDGWIDLAVGASAAEDRDADPVVGGQGGVYIYLGGPNGFSTQPSQKLYGSSPDENGQWVATGSMQFGNDLASGDMDGDGLCELAVSSRLRNTVTGVANGSVYIYRGKGPGSFFQGGVHSTPSEAWTDSSPTQQGFALNISMGDVTNDGSSDLFMSHTGYMPDINQAGTAQGAAFLFSGSDLSESYATELEQIRESGIWMHRSSDLPQSWDSAGWRGHFGDMDDDGLIDLIIADVSDEITSSELDPMGLSSGTNAGVLTLYKGKEGELPDSTPSGYLVGHEANDYISHAAVLDDLDGDGKKDLVLFASAKDFIGRDTGLPYFVSGGIDVQPTITDTTGKFHELEFPMEISGHEFGQSVAFVTDRNGDGRPEMVIGAPGDTVPSITSWGVRHGTAHVYLSTSDGYEVMPTESLSGHFGHRPGQLYGYAVGDLGDFNGDGIPDLGVVSRYHPLQSAATYHAWGYYGDAFTDNEGGEAGVYDPGIDTLYDGNENGVYDPGYGFNACAGEASVGSTGALFVHLGVEGEEQLYEPEPAFRLFHLKASTHTQFMTGNLDVNGDGYDDVLISSQYWGRAVKNEEGETIDTKIRAGGVQVFWGRPVSAPGEKVILCDGVDVFLGVNQDDAISRTTSMGNLNGDSCADFAFAGYATDGENVNQGMVWVALGWGGADCPTEPQFVSLAPHFNSELAGISLDGGKDIDGDGLPDLLVGAQGIRVENIAVGGAYLVPGSYLNSLTFEPHDDPDTLKPSNPLISTSSQVVLQVNGSTPGGLAGRSVSIVEDLGDGVSGVALGAPMSALSGTVQSGGVAIHRYTPGEGLEPLPSIIMGGESERPGGRLGEVMASYKTESGTLLSVGAYLGFGMGLDSGSAYVISLESASEEGEEPTLPTDGAQEND